MRAPKQKSETSPTAIQNQLAELVKSIIAHKQSMKAVIPNNRDKPAITAIPYWDEYIGTGIEPIKLNTKVHITYAYKKGAMFRQVPHYVWNLYIHANGEFFITTSFSDPLRSDTFQGWDAFLQVLPQALPQIQEELEKRAAESLAGSKRLELTNQVLAPWAAIQALEDK